MTLSKRATLSRREVLRRGALLGASLPAAGAWLGGCRSRPPPGAERAGVAPRSAGAAGPYVFTGEWKTRFASPKAVAVDGQGALYIACAGGFGGLHKVRRTAAGDGFESVWDAGGDRDKRSVRGVAVGPDGDVLVTTTQDKVHEVRRYTSGGAPAGAWGSAGAEEGQLRGPTGVAVDRAGNVYVIEAEWWGLAGGNRIQKFAPDGKLLKKWGAAGSAPGQFNLPTGAALDREGNLVVADTYNCRLQKFAPDGTFLAAWGAYGNRAGEFDRPQGVAFDAAGNLYVADTFNNRIQKFAPDGAFLAAWGRRGAAAGELWLPCGAAVDSAGDVIVADTMNNRVQVFRPRPEGE